MLSLVSRPLCWSSSCCGQPILQLPSRLSRRRSLSEHSAMKNTKQSKVINMNEQIPTYILTLLHGLFLGFLVSPSGWVLLPYTITVPVLCLSLVCSSLGWWLDSRSSAHLQSQFLLQVFCVLPVVWFPEGMIWFHLLWSFLFWMVLIWSIFFFFCSGLSWFYILYSALFWFDLVRSDLSWFTLVWSGLIA